MTLSVADVDVTDEPAFKSWYDTYLEGDEADRVDPTSWTYPESLVSFRRTEASEKRWAIAAHAGGECVGAGWIALPLLDNLGLVHLSVAVPPKHRGQGVGSALLSYVLDLAAREGRSSLLTTQTMPVDAESTWPGVRFASRWGFTLRNKEIRRQQALPVPPATLSALESHAAERGGDYRLVSWAGACPDEYAEEYAHLKSLLMTEAPMGSLDYEQEVWDVARLREEEARAVALDRTLYSTIALAADGTIGGHTQLAVPGHDPSRAYQWDTLVRSSHRGHRLGLAVKVANVRALQEGHPGVRRVDTWNAEQNGPMVAVNEALGYRIIEHLQEWQRDV